jgi:hypothetical protein
VVSTICPLSALTNSREPSTAKWVRKAGRGSQSARGGSSALATIRLTLQPSIGSIETRLLSLYNHFPRICFSQGLNAPPPIQNPALHCCAPYPAFEDGDAFQKLKALGKRLK